MTYYVMEGEGVYPIITIEKQPDLPGGPWYHGHKLKITFPTPLDYVLEKDPDDPEDCNIKMLYDNKAIPVMHNTLVEALQSTGVNNLELFPARITNPNTGKVHEDYQAFNVVGLVSAADLENSTLMNEADTPTLLDTDFDSLVIDESKTMGFRLFRLAENCSAIVVDEKVKAAIEERGIPGIVFYGPGEWSG
jgi:Immunity protein family (Imm11)